jgi:transposase
MQPQFERLTDDQWKGIKHFLNSQRKRKYDLREILNAILWITRTGCQWRNMDKSFPPWESVYYYFDKWGKDGTWELLCQSLNMVERIQLDRQETPSLGFVDSQSVKLSPMLFKSRGVDGNKKINGRKRQILVDILGRLWKVKVHAAHLHDSPQGVDLLDELLEEIPRLEKIMADKSYRGTFAQAVEKIGLVFEVPHRPEGTVGFAVEAKRWVVERTFAWLNFFRRVVMDYERTPQSAQSFLLLANISIVIWRIDWSVL